MKSLTRSIRRVITSQSGASLVEYGLLVALIAAVCVVVVQTLGTKISSIFTAVAAAL